MAESASKEPVLLKVQVLLPEYYCEMDIICYSPRAFPALRNLG